MEKTATTLRPVAAVIEEFARAARQSGQYPPEHAMAQAANTRAWQALLKLFPEASGEVVQLSSYPAGLQFNGQELPEMGPGQVWLNEGLRRRLIKTLVFQPELQTSDAIALITLLAAEPEEILAQGKPQDWLTKNGGLHLRAEEQDYHRLLRESEATLIDLVAEEKDPASQEIIRHCLSQLEIDLAPRLGRRADDNAPSLTALSLPNLIALLEYVSLPSAGKKDTALPENLPLTTDLTALAEMELTPADFLAFGLANTIQTGFQALTAQGGDLTAWKADLQQQILRLEPETRARLFRAPLITPETPDALAELAKGLTPEVLIEQVIFPLPEALIGETSSALERLFRRVMPSPEQQVKLDPLLRERFLRAGNSPETYRNVVGLLLDSLAKNQMLAEDRPGYHLTSSSLDQISIFTPMAIDDLLASMAPEAVARARSIMALDLLEEKLPLAEYATLCDELVLWAQYWLGRREDILTRDLLSALGEEIVSRRENSHRLIALTALKQISTAENAVGLAEQIAGAPEEQQNPLLQVLARLGKPGGEELLKLVFREGNDELSQRAALAACATEASPQENFRQEKPQVTLMADSQLPQESFAPAHLLNRRLATGAAEEVVRILNLLLGGNCPAALQVAAGALYNPRSWVGVALLKMLGERNLPGAGPLLLAGLDSSRPEFQLEAARSLDKLAKTLPAEIIHRALGPLVRLAQSGGLSGSRLALRLQALATLGALGQDTALPALAGLLAARGWFYAKGRARIRFAAAAALAEIASPSAGEILQRGRHSAYAGTAQACQAALEQYREKAANSSEHFPAGP